MGKSKRQRIEEENARVEERELNRGHRFRIHWVHNSGLFGPKYFASRELAEQHCEWMMKENAKPLPIDYYEGRRVG